MAFNRRDPRVPRRPSLDAVLGYAWGSVAEGFTATEAMQATGMARSTAIEAMNDLVRLGLLRELPNARVLGDYRKGRPSRCFQFADDAAVVVGVDAGRAHLVITVADLRGRPLAVRRLSLDEGPDSGPEEPAERCVLITKAVDAALADAGASRDDALVLCFGVPAPVDRNGRSPAHPTGFWAGMNPDLVDVFSRWAPLVRVENDAALAAVAEGTQGAAVGLSDYVTVLAGERLGVGAVVDGHLLRGARGGAGEPFFARHIDGVEDQHGLGYKIAEWARMLRDEGALPADHPLITAATNDATGSAVLALARTGDPQARALVERGGRTLGRIAGVLVNVYDPIRIVITGGLATDAEGLLEVARAVLPEQSDLPAPELVASPLGADVVSIGAVAAALETARAQALHLPAADLTLALPAERHALGGLPA